MICVCYLRIAIMPGTMQSLIFWSLVAKHSHKLKLFILCLTLVPASNSFAVWVIFAVLCKSNLSHTQSNASGSMGTPCLGSWRAQTSTLQTLVLLNLPACDQGSSILMSTPALHSVMFWASPAEPDQHLVCIVVFHPWTSAAAHGGCLWLDLTQQLL